MTTVVDEFDLDIRLTEAVEAPAGPATSNEICTTGCRTCGQTSPCKTLDC